MKDDVKKYCDECLIYERNKSLALSPARFLILDITMDFIDELPMAARYDVILVVVDKLSKYTHFMALKHPYTAKSMPEHL